jgi:3-isopropylmalate dehydrogenase
MNVIGEAGNMLEKGASYSLAVLPGDGIGPEVVDAALMVLNAVEKREGFSTVISKGLIGGAAYDVYGEHLPRATIDICRGSSAILFGAVGGPVIEAATPKWANCERNSILSLRKEFGFYANIRSLRVPSGLEHLSPLRQGLIPGGHSIVVIRELLGDIYFGEHKTTGVSPARIASDTAEYREGEIRRIARLGFELARARRRSVVSVDKANVLDTSRLWRDVVTSVQREFPDVTVEHQLVDNCAMQLVRNPAQFDLLLCPNLFGDILSDIVSVLGGSLGLMPSASLNEEGFGLYEPAGGSAPDIAGKGIANPIGQILSLAMLLRYSWRMDGAANAIEMAVESALASGARTCDLCRSGEPSVSTEEFAEAVVQALMV